MKELAIQVKNLTKHYKASGNQQVKVALDNLDLEVPRGSIFGLLGPNGAGKSTLINILSGTVVKTSGLVNIMGIDIDQHSKSARSKIGVVPQEIVVDSFFPLYPALEFYAGYHGIRPANRKSDEILKSLSLYEKRNSLPTQLSGGMKRRFLIAKALVHNPDVIILDEPTAGVDIELRDQLWDFVRKLNSAGKTIILTTHYLAEAQELCDEIAFINNGKIVKQSKKDSLLEELGVRSLTIEFIDNINPEQIKSLNIACEVYDGNKIKFNISTGDNHFNEILSAVSSLNLKIKDLRVIQPDLEDIFYKIVKR